MQLRDGHLWLSPSDLSAHLACPYLTRLEFESAHGERSRPHGRDELADLVARKGDEHEEAFLAQLRHDGRDVVDVTVAEGGFAAAATATENAMRAGAEVIYQATFARDGWRGRADFLVRVDEPSDLGAWSYEPYDTKLARIGEAGRGAPARLVRERDRSDPGTAAGAAARRARHERGRDLPAGRRRRLSAHRAAAAARARRGAAGDIYPWPCEHCSRCDFIPVCRERWEADDHLTRVASIRRDQIEQARDASTSRRSPASRESPADLARAPARAADARAAARPGGLQLHRYRTGELTYRLLAPEERRGLGLLPAPSPGDVFFDMEGDPFFDPAARARVPVRRALARARRR